MTKPIARDPIYRSRRFEAEIRSEKSPVLLCRQCTRTMVNIGRRTLVSPRRRFISMPMMRDAVRLPVEA
jgi:hypothetical protein